jgi:asparagine synthase (glutamine-hydrolysing)
MAQLFGCIHPRDPAGAAAAARNMGRWQQRPSQSAPEIWTDAATAAGLGAVGSREYGGLTPLEPSGEGRGAILLDGEIYRAATGNGGVPPRGPEAIGRLHAEAESGVAARLDGSFALAIHDARRKKLILATDRSSTRTLYWARVADGFLFASELKAFLGAPWFRPRLDPAAVSECFAYHRILSNRTLLEGVERLPPATVLEVDLESGSVRKERYWRPEDEVRRREPLSAERLEAISAAFHDAVLARLPAANIGVSLSGGLDSRAIVAILAAEHRKAATCTTGMEGCTDERLARRISSIADVAHFFYPLTREKIQGYVEALRAAVFITDGMILVGGFPGGLTQAFCDDHGIDVLLRGHGGENARLEKAWPFQVDDRVLSLRTRDDLLLHARASLSAAPRDLDWGRLFPESESRPTPAAAAAALEALVSSFDGDLSPAELASLLYLAQNDSREVPNTRNALRSHAEMALPYLDYRFLSEVLATAVSERCGPAIHLEIVRRYCPRLMKVPNSNTGAPLDASRLRQALSDKLNTLLRKVRFPGFRHYHYMEVWIRDYLAAEVRALILDERTLGRGLFGRDYLTDLVERARGDASLSRLLNLIVNLEIWCRLFLDGEARPAHPAEPS